MNFVLLIFFLNVFDTLEILYGLNVSFNFLWQKCDSLSENGPFYPPSKTKCDAQQGEDKYSNTGAHMPFNVKYLYLKYQVCYQDFIF